jgi:hypothetical protein
MPRTSHLRCAAIAVFGALLLLGAHARDRQVANDAAPPRVWLIADPAPVSDDEIRAAFVGHEAHPPQPWPVSFGPYEFRADGSYFRQQDLASSYGHYAIKDGLICISDAPDGPANQCYKVLRNGTQYYLQYTGATGAPFEITLHPIPQAK